MSGGGTGIEEKENTGGMNVKRMVVLCRAVGHLTSYPVRAKH